MAKRIIAMALTIACVVSLVSGCVQKQTFDGIPVDSYETYSSYGSLAEVSYGDTGGLALPIADKPVTVKWMLRSNFTGLDAKPVISEIEKRTGITVKIQALAPEVYSEKIDLVIASGKLPDIMEGFPADKLNTIGPQGVLTAINKYADELPNFRKLYLEENKWVIDAYADTCGNLYAWPVYGLSLEADDGFMYRKDIFDRLGIKEWTTPEEFHQTLVKLKGVYPDSHPYVSKAGTGIFKDWASSWGLRTGEGYPVYFDEADKKWKLAITGQSFRYMLDFMRRLYCEGLLDPAFLSSEEASWREQIISWDKAFVTFSSISQLDKLNKQAKRVNPGYDLRCVNPLVLAELKKSQVRIIDLGNAISVSENTEMALKLMDYLTSPSGAELMVLGIRNREFKLRTCGRVVYKEPVLKFNDNEADTINKLREALDKAGIEFASRYVTDSTYGGKQWREWIAEASAKGAGKLLEIYNKAQLRNNTKKGD